jgi:hypothetical protein
MNYFTQIIKRRMIQIFNLDITIHRIEGEIINSFKSIPGCEISESGSNVFFT